MKVGEMITMLRKEHGYSRTDFANKIGTPHTTLRNYELGVREPGHSFIIQMASEFGVSTDFLLGLTPERKNPPAKAEGPYLTNKAYEVARAYQGADQHIKDIVCVTLGLEPDKSASALSDAAV